MKRIIRKRQLTPEEAEKYQIIRNQIEQIMNSQQTEQAENILNTLEKQRFANWYINGDFDKYIVRDIPCPTREEILEQIVILFRLNTDRMSLYRKHKIKSTFGLSDLENAYIKGFNHALKLADAYIEDKRLKRKKRK